MGAHCEGDAIAGCLRPRGSGRIGADRAEKSGFGHVVWGPIGREPPRVRPRPYPERYVETTVQIERLRDKMSSRNSCEPKMSKEALMTVFGGGVGGSTWD